MPDIFQIGADLGEMAKAVASADDKMRLVEAAMALNELAVENKRLMDENAGLRVELARRKALEYRGGSYYLIEGDGSEVGPVCPRCYRAEVLISRLERANGGARCSVCGTRYAGSRHAVDGYRQRVL